MTSMTMTLMLPVLLFAPLAISLLLFMAGGLPLRSRALAGILHLAGITLMLVLALLVICQTLTTGPVDALSGWLRVDALGAIFLGLVGIVGFITGLYSIGYMNHELAENKISPRQLFNYYAIFDLFLFTMLLAVTANNIIMMWVAIEATTLASTFLVGFNGKKSSLEAAWKYIVICTVGLAFGLYGVVLVYSNAASLPGVHGSAAFWTVLLGEAHRFDPALMKIAFIFVMIGFGTKAGFFPMHTWVPDAYSEAPSPVSALLSAVLSNCVLLLIIRFYILVSQTLGYAFPQLLMTFFGLLSLAVAAFFIISQRNIKRLLAYSSVETLGFIAIGIGLGSPLGVMAALLHTINNSMAKGLLFCSSGNVILKYGSPDLKVVKGLLRVAPLTGILFGAGALALGGIPPFNIFFSELMIVVAGIKSGNGWLMLVCVVLLTVVLAGLVRMVAAALFGPKPDTVQKGETGVLTLLPLCVLLAFMLWFGISLPQSVNTLLDRATGIVLNQNAPQITGMAGKTTSPAAAIVAAARQGQAQE